jgi:hypothetical protein
MKYSRAHPSPRYIELQGLYRAMHEQGETFLGIPPEQTFAGHSLAPQVERIKELVERTGSRTLLDYGSGKGMQYEPHAIRDRSGISLPSVIDYWNVDEVVCYDPCYAPYNQLPNGTFDGVICTDVLEHCPEDDMSWIVSELFSFARRFVFANVACYPATKRLPNGERAHCTVRPFEWWKVLFESIAAQHAALTWEVWVSTLAEGPEGRKFVDHRMGSSA